MAIHANSHRPRDWDAATYESLPLPHERWAALAISRLRLTGSEHVVDFGCGTGRDTVRLLPMLPYGRVIAIDGSQRMLAALRARLGSDADRVQVLKADLNRPLPVDDPVDAVVSVATLHWLPDHSAVFRHIADALRPGGQFVADFGGYGNVATVTAALADVLGSEMPADVWNFPGPDETRRRLEDAGFADISVDLAPDLVTFANERQFEQYLHTVVLGGHIRSISRRRRAGLARSVATRLQRRELDYVRLRVNARKSHTPR
jgi:trans-aconitate 2-methyltransferase